MLFRVCLFSFAMCAGVFAYATCLEGTKRANQDGVTVVCDNANPALGEAWRTPNGTIWGSPAHETQSSQLSYMTLDQAKNYCASIKAQIPEDSDIEYLQLYVRDYFQAGTQNPLLPELFDNGMFWTSSPLIGPSYGPDQYSVYRVVKAAAFPIQGFFNGSDSSVHVRCIVRK